MATGLTLEFADGEYPFKLSLVGIMELQTKTKIGMGGLVARVLSGRYTGKDGEAFGFPLEARWHVEDLHNSIRLALIGGGMDAVDANRLVTNYCYPNRALNKDWTLAAAILTAAMEDVAEGLKDVPGENNAVKKKSEPTKTRTVKSTEQQSAQT